jgi:DNA helicase HerA-like ATPase
VGEFAKTISEAYKAEGATIDLGRGVHDGKLATDAIVQLPLRMMNRHADVKGDVSGVAAPGESGGPAEKRMTELGLSFDPKGFPVEFLSLGGIGSGVPVRATVSDFGPQLLAKILDANETQEQSLQIVFHYADQKGLALVDRADLRALLTFLESDEGKPELEGIGGLASSTVGVLLRALVGLETGGGNEFFGEPQLDVADLMRTAPDSRGVISVPELPAVQDKPKLVFFFDEAHLLFDGATKAFLDAVTQTVRLIRSKGVGVFFVTQVPDDVPSDVLGQLGNRVQHPLRAFTPDDAKALKAAASTYPTSEFYGVDELLTSMGIGEAAVTILSDEGVPTPVVHTRIRAPASRIGPAEDVEGAAKSSDLFAKYGARTEAESAREKLGARLDKAEGAPAPARQRHKARAPAPSSPLEELGDFLGSRQGKALQRKVARGMFGMLKKRL